AAVTPAASPPRMVRPTSAPERPITAPLVSPSRPNTARAPALDAILARAIGAGASDILVHPDSVVRQRVAGTLVAGEGRFTAAQTDELLSRIVPEDLREVLRVDGEIDFTYPVAEVGRFRTSIYRQHRGLSGVFHFAPLTPPTLESLGLPQDLARVTTYPQGMVLVTGPAGCGKTSTLAALVDLINEERHDHILTIEDPIEYLHTSKRCFVNQRQVRRHTESFARALRAALREDPDVICIGELRDLETISLAMSAAETGHLVLATLHTNSAIRTINRIVGAFPSSQQGQIRTMLSESLRAVISQRLLPAATGQGVVAALEILHVNPAIGNLIRDNKTFQIASVLLTGRTRGQKALDHSLTELVQAGVITAEVAAANSENPTAFKGGK
ncbi:MAG: PilT/PilU family type 4a pilus ATPase, partial [Deltaproteobacteria bacterium]|nr:PilT/PilU family type 4a pilus ATPase [Deltaproteobacteria bacterium]